MKTKDFDFMLRKEFLILCLLLLTVTFTQVSLGQMSGIIKSRPLLVLNFAFFDVLGIILPVISGIYIYANYRTKHDHPRILFFLSIAVIIIAILTIVTIFGLSFRNEGEPEEAPILPSNNTSTSPISIPSTITEMTQQTTETTQVIPSPVNLLELNDFFQFLQNLGIIFLIFLFFLPLLFMLIIRRRSDKVEISTEDTGVSLGDKELNQHKMRTVLECYYQASTALEERGADNSVSFTPTEFSQDVVNKTLTSPPKIKNLTNVFEEAKFSNHSITNQQVKLAKSLASEIIFSSDSLDEKEEESEKIED